jgi:hypothetical protein
MRMRQHSSAVRVTVTRLAVLTAIVAAALLTLALAVSTTAARQPTMYDGLPAWSRHGDLAYAHAQRRAEWIMVRDRNGASRRLLENPESFRCMHALDYSPDGRTPSN